ncbi:MAG: protein translocase subunit SecD [Nitrospinae bacterium]|nr:protein translocase subunit SecD [Nitrospinota bacterium]
MNRSILWRLAVIAVVVGVAAFAAWPLDKKINLGLDLQGGMHLVYEVDADKAVLSSIDTTADDLGKYLKSKGVILSSVRREGETIALSFPDADQTRAAAVVVKEDFTILDPSEATETGLVYALTADQRKTVFDNAIDQALETLRNRIDQFGVAEPVIQREGGARILIQLPGVRDRERAIGIIGKTARLEFRLLNEKTTVSEAQELGAPMDSQILFEKEYDRVTKKVIGRTPYLVKRKVELSGDAITEASVRVNQMNQPYVSIDFSKEGGRTFARLTSENVGKRMAIVLDGSIYSAPVIRESITGGSAMIDGTFSYEEARDLALVLRAGALPAPLIKLEERSVGPSLGHDSIEAGVVSSVVGTLAVFLFMLVYYRFGGIVADVALFLNIVILMGTLAYFGATLTLPGIAGIILTIGMAVDSNVLIFERIREELSVGKTVRAAVDAGFEKAFLTIVDSNITTLIAAVVLFQFGTGPVKGFAVTLTLGLLASMFTAIFVSRTLFNAYLGGRRVSKLSI